MLVESAGDCTVLHEKVLFDSRGCDLYVKGLVLDKYFASVTLYVRPHDDRPGFDESVLVVGGLNAIDAHELLDNSVNPFCVTFSHGIVCHYIL